MTILVADSFSPAAQERLRMAGHTLISEPSLKDDALTAALAEHSPEVLIVRSTKVTPEALDASPNLELVVRAGAGVDTISVDGASRRGIFVANCPGKNAAAVAELAWGLILALDRRIPDNVAEARGGTWNKKEFAGARGVQGRTLGLIGMGSIGHEMVTRAKAFGMPVVAWSRSLTASGAADLGVHHAATPLDVARQADVVSVHVASTPDTRHLVDDAFVDAMREGAFLLNTSRADVVDETAVARGLDEKGLRFATDVPANEPQDKQTEDWDYALQDHPSVYITHHVGASTDEATEAIGQEAARVVLTYAETGRVENGVNLADQTPATHLLTVRHLDRVGVLAGVLEVAREAGWNVQEMENLIFAGAEAACARIRFDGEPDAATLDRIRDVEHVIAAKALAL
ncbi:NAD(P)-dependent oxidoreductase [Rubricoccus marinus]|uniref:Hydroxyacid dehydrogenase n=1 Tax=Rubricoccus marinus TaxID=716817 RepID=A0A259U0L5_9BACT|nr:NAD(P)-dependent oxidoreductase [Rubricoccus marinus]OZC03539.1 hydroxyacid dehydrogenase [Rubricoccus marinus]